MERLREAVHKNKEQELEVCCNHKRTQSHKFYCAQGMTNNHYKFCLPLKS